MAATTMDREAMTRESQPSPPVPGAGGGPSFRLPGEHFAAAGLFLLLGCVGLIGVGPDLARGAFALPRVAGVTHLFTLGWITTSIMGALYQFVPVALGRPIGSERLAHATFVLYAPGVAAFAGGLALGSHSLMLAGAALFGTGIVLFGVNLATTLAAADRRGVTWWALAGADLFLMVTLVLGMALAGNLRWGFLGADRIPALGVHLHVALAGWVLLVMIGVGHRLLPMFLLSHGVGEGGSRAAVILVTTGTAILVVGHHGPPPVARWLPAVLVVGGVAAFLLQARRFYQHRKRPALDPGMRTAAAGLAIVGLGVGLAAPVMAGVAPPRMATAYVAALVAGISVFVAAHYYKIVPFLVWYHRFGPLVGRRDVPTVAQLYGARAASLAGAMLAVGALALVGSVAAGWGGGTRVAGLLMLGGATLEGWQMARLTRVGPA